MWIPIVFVAVCAFLIVVPCYVAPVEVGMGVLITVIGIPIFYLNSLWKNKPACVLNAVERVTVLCQKAFLSVKED